MGCNKSSEKYLRGGFLQPFPEISASEIGQEKRHNAVAQGAAGVVSIDSWRHLQSSIGRS